MFFFAVVLRKGRNEMRVFIMEGKSFQNVPATFIFGTEFKGEKN